MILASLRDLALREGLVSEPAFESKGVAWIVNIDRDGRFLSLQSTLSDPVADEKGRKPKPQPAMMSIPRRAGRTVNIGADFLVEKSEYVFGVVPEGKAASKKADKPEKCRNSFLKLMSDAAQETGSPPLKAAVSFLESEEQRKACVADLNKNKWASNDLFAFSCGFEHLHLAPRIRQWWAARAKEGDEPEDKLRQCVICGQRRLPVENHDALRIAGGVTSGVPLVSFNAAAFEKYGFSRNENAPVCRPCMTAYVEGLRRCLNQRYPSPNEPTEMMGQQAVRLSPDTTAVYWTDTPWGVAGQLSLILNQPSDLRAALLSPRTGTRRGELDAAFYCVILSGAQGRAMLRSVHKGTVEQVEQSLCAYFDALKLDGLDPDQPLPLYFLLKSLAPQEKLDRLSPKLPGEIFLAAVLGQPVPRIVLSAAVSRNRAEQKVTPARAALLQLYFSLQKLRSQPEVPCMSLDPEFHAPGYLFGRLFAVLERVQLLASPGVSSTIVDRFYGAASTRPGTVFPQLLRLNQAHLAKVPAKRNPDWYRKLTGEIMDGLPAQFEPTLDITEQGLFALGYYHQRQAFYRKAPAPQPELENGKAEVTDEGETE
jgi:CRISPR-associated protein Csd1